MQEWFARRHPKAPADSDAVYRAAIRAKALDTLRGLLPAATQSNVGMYGTGQAYESLLLRMRAHPLAEVARDGRRDARRAAQGHPRVSDARRSADRGGRWSAYLADARARTAEARGATDGATPPGPRRSDAGRFRSGGRDEGRRGRAVSVDVAAGRRAAGDRAADVAQTSARRCCAHTSATAANRRHKPGRAFERTSYRFDVLTDYGAFRDLQRHRLLTIEWQSLSPRHGYVAAGSDRRSRRRRGVAAT